MNKSQGDTPNKLQIILADFGGKVLQDQATTTKRIEPVVAAIKTLLLEMVGEDDDTSHEHMLAFKNELRAELREKIKEF